MRLSHTARNERRAIIRDRLHAGEDAKALADEYGLTLTYIYRIGRGACMSRKAIMAGKRRAQLREFYALGQTQAAFVRLTGMHRVNVSRAARELGLKFPKDTAGWQLTIAESARRAETMAALYRAGYTLQQIGGQYGISRERVRQLLGKFARLSGGDGGASVRAAAKAERRKAARSARYLAKYGCLPADYNRIPMKARAAFRSQVSAARYRKIDWELTLWQWWTIWQESGHWEQRGRGQGYVMCRKGDEGPYAIGNVFIATAIENSSTAKHKKSGLPTGVVCRRGHFAAHRMIAGKKLYLGAFDTPDLAHAAYLMAGEQQARAA